MHRHFILSRRYHRFLLTFLVPTIITSLISELDGQNEFNVRRNDLANCRHFQKDSETILIPFLCLVEITDFICVFMFIEFAIQRHIIIR